MTSLDFSRCRLLNNIPNRKLQDHLSVIENNSDNLQIKNIKLTAINRYFESNIPIEYWTLKMDKDFNGDNRLLKKYEEYVSNLKETYVNGKSICFAGNSGVGKTMTLTCILKKAVEKGYSCLYSDLSHITSVLTQAPGDEKLIAIRELSLVDFLVIDEVDNRFFNNSEAANEMFSKTLERILRNRLQNKLPTLIATNSPNIKESFTSLFKVSLGSLMSKIEFFVVLGEDFRKRESK